MSLIHQIALTLIKSVGHVTAKNLLAHFGSAEAIFTADKSELLTVGGIGELTARQILNTNALSLAAEQLGVIRQHKIEVLFYTGERYPWRLRECYDAPVLLYYKGNADLNHSRIVSIVGTRNATAYGQALCRQLAETLAPYNVLIVSGLAYGIDVAAHKESLSSNIPTIGVLGHGLDRMYPAGHRQIAGKMLNNGGLLSEFPLGTEPYKDNFPKRNRIIAGISDLTIVVEAAMKGGALITAEIAGSYNRDVFAFPGRTSDIYSQGCNFLIKTNRAGLITHPKDLIYYMGWDDAQVVTPDKQMEIPLHLSTEETKILTILRNSSLSIDELGTAAGIQQNKLAIYLLGLELKGLIIATPGKVYTLGLGL
jgi:DNA processing protein